MQRDSKSCDSSPWRCGSVVRLSSWAPGCKTKPFTTWFWKAYNTSRMLVSSIKQYHPRISSSSRSVCEPICLADIHKQFCGQCLMATAVLLKSAQVVDFRLPIRELSLEIFTHKLGVSSQRSGEGLSVPSVTCPGVIKFFYSLFMYLLINYKPKN